MTALSILWAAVTGCLYAVVLGWAREVREEGRPWAWWVYPLAFVLVAAWPLWLAFALFG